jgi:Na+/H+ antiporter NhaD/arsenite permease-like protein
MSAGGGAVVGVLLALLLPAARDDAGVYQIPLWLISPFVLLLLSVAVAPLISPRWWHRHYPDVSLFLGALVGAYYLAAFSGSGKGGMSVGGYAVVHAALEYYGFVALVGGLYLASGGIAIGLRGRAGLMSNTILLLIGAVLANVLGTTGASVLLIRPFIASNHGRLRPMHVVFFILIVSNCGGVLTPIGDPPLYLGYLKGLPFFWFLMALWKSWVLVVLPLLAIFAAYDAMVLRQDTRNNRTGTLLAGSSETASASLLPRFTLRARGVSLALMAMIIGAVFIDPALQRLWHLQLPVGPTFQIVLALVALRVARKDILEQNEFSWDAVKEVGLLFAGIFATMMPALAYLAAEGEELGLESPSAFYWSTGALSAVLDNAPTFLSFVQLAMTPQPVERDGLLAMIQTESGDQTLQAIAAGAVFFGALTYIGNGPNFMVRTIAIRAGVEMPSFFSYVGRALLVLGPVLVLHWLVRVA